MKLAVPGARREGETTVLVRKPPPPMPEAPREDPPPDRDLWPWLVVVATLVIAGIAAAWFATRGGNTRTITQTVTTVPPLPQRAPKPAVVEATVPKLVGLQSPDALQALVRAGLTGKTFGVFSDAPPGEVTGQDPGVTTRMRRGSIVTLAVSKGKKTLPVPDVVGQEVAAAIDSFKAQGFVARVVRVPSTQPTGQVVAQAPAGATNAPANSSVRLNVSSGPSTTGGTVPDVRGEDEKTARHDLQQAGFSVDSVRQDVTDESQNRIVIDQSPKPDEPASADSHVTIVVGRYKHEHD
jgi:beta-lactam-binding protein with PASTA domain